MTQEKIHAQDVVSALKAKGLSAHCTQGRNGKAGIGVENNYDHGILVHIHGDERQMARATNAIEKGLKETPYIVRPFKEQGILQVIKEVF